MFNKRCHMLENNGNKKRNGSSIVNCVCPICGYSIPHEKGVRCRSLQCPRCHVALLPDNYYKSNTFSCDKNAVKDLNYNKQKIKFPLVNKEKCTGCGSCIDNCPQKAICLRDNVAFINIDKCKRCRKCVQICPVNAIE